ncbi:MAG: wax ester/triacylglycerol synthase family O-acyltransferase [Myxococcota bacterium]
MHQLSGLDNAFLVMETGGQLGHIASVSFFDTSGAKQGDFYQAIRSTIEERLHLLPPYRRRLVEVPLDLDRPYWIEDPNFDLDFHLRHIAVPPPGDDGQLAELISRLHSRALDRSRPLWEVYVIEGLEGGRAALYSKIHHCTVDGVSGAEMTQALLDHVPEGDPVPAPNETWRPEPIPPSTEMLTRGVLGLATSPGRFARTLYRTARTLWENNEALGAVAQSTGLDQLPFAGGWLRTTGPEVDADRVPQNPAPRTPFNRAITPHRRFAFFSLPLADFKRVKNAFGTSLNDAVMAVTGSALRRYLEARHALPEHPLVAMVPVSVRSENQVRDYTNRVTQVLAELATDAEDPVERLRRIHAAMGEAKRMQRATPATLLTDWTEVATPALFAQAARIAARTKIMDRLNPPFNVIISNVPGPRESLYCGGFEMETYFPVSAIADGQGLNVTVTSYRDHLDFGLIVCRELVPDVWRFKEYFAESLEELVKAADSAGGA